MKVKLLTIVLATLTIGASAQVDQGAIFFSGGFNYFSTESTMEIQDQFGPITIDADLSDFSINLSGGAMLTDEIGAGLRIGFGSSGLTSQNEDFDQKLVNSTFSISPFGRYYLDIDAPLYGVVELGVGIGQQKATTTVDGNENDIKFRIFDVGLRPGVSFFMGDNLALDVFFGHLGYSSSTLQIEGDAGDADLTVGTFTFGANLNTVMLGLTIMANN